MHIGFFELLLVLCIVLLFFGASKLPKLAKTAGQSVNIFKKALKSGDDGNEDVNEKDKEDK